MLVVAGVDVGGTNTKTGLVNREGKLISKSKFSTSNCANEFEFVERLKENIDQLKEACPKEVKLGGIGIGVPKANYFKGTVEGAVNLNWSPIVELVKLLEEKMQVPVVITNDANLAAIGEKKFGGAKKMDNFLSVTLGTGLGCGVFLDGKLFHGEMDIAGELGHTSVRSKGRYCACGKRGCLETYVSANGLKRTVFKYMAELLEESPLRNISFHEMTSDRVCEAAFAGDQVAIKSVDYTAKILGFKLADVFALFNPEAVFITGGLANARELLFEPTLKSIQENIYKTYQTPIRIFPSALKDDEIAVLGGSALMWEQLDKEKQKVL